MRFKSDFCSSFILRAGRIQASGLRASEKQAGNPLEKQVGNGFSMLAVTLGRFRSLVFDLEPTTEKQSRKGSLLQPISDERPGFGRNSGLRWKRRPGFPEFVSFCSSLQRAIRALCFQDEIGQSRSSLNSDSELRLVWRAPMKPAP